jgi:putative intracellular protease/amidase
MLARMTWSRLKWAGRAAMACTVLYTVCCAVLREAGGGEAVVVSQESSKRVEAVEAGNSRLTLRGSKLATYDTHDGYDVLHFAGGRAARSLGPR